MEIETARLRLRPFVPTDAADHARLYSDPAVTQYLGGGPYLGPDAAERSRLTLARFAEHWARLGFGVWAVVDRASGGVIGQCGLNTLPERAEIEVLYALERARWGQGLAAEAARAALRFGFEVVGLDRIVAVVRPENRASQRVLEKLGLAPAGAVEVYGMRAAYYAIARADFAGA